MRIFVDADGCPVVKIVERVAKKHKIPCTLLCDINHMLSSDYSEVIIVDAGMDAVDFKLVSLIQKGDICVTQDYGVAAMVLGKGALGIHQSGRWYTNENIDELLMQRHMAKKARRSSKKSHLKGPAKRTQEDDMRFEASFEKMISRAENVLYRVKRIDEDLDFGCEERPEGQPVMARVTLVYPSGEEIIVRAEDAMLYDRDINEGDRVFYDKDHRLAKDREDPYPG